MILVNFIKYLHLLVEFFVFFVVILQEISECAGSPCKSSHTNYHYNDAKYALYRILTTYVTVTNGWKCGYREVKWSYIEVRNTHFLKVFIQPCWLIFVCKLRKEDPKTCYDMYDHEWKNYEEKEALKPSTNTKHILSLFHDFIPFVCDSSNSKKLHEFDQFV